MATPGSVVVWEWLFHSTHWLPYEPAVSNYVETVHAQWLARGGARAWPNQSIVDLKNASSTLALFVVDLNTMSQTNQSTGTYCCLLGGNRFVQTDSDCILQEAQLSLRDRATRACQLKSGKVLHKCRRLVFEKL